MACDYMRVFQQRRVLILAKVQNASRVEMGNFFTEGAL